MGVASQGVVIEARDGRMSNLDPKDLSIGLRVLEATLTGEMWFIDQTQEAALEHLRRQPGKNGASLSKADFPTLASAAGYRHLTTLAQFYFAMHAFDCTSKEQIATLIHQHNAKITAELDGDSEASPRELQRAHFSPKRAAQVISTVHHFESLVFSVSELGSLLIDVMAPRTTETLVLDLLHGGIMRHRGVGDEDCPPDTDPRRVLVEPTEYFLETYVASLVLIHDQITGS